MNLDQIKSAAEEVGLIVDGIFVDGIWLRASDGTALKILAEGPNGT